MTINRRHFLAATAAAGLIGRAARAETPLSIVATTGMIADTAAKIGGAAVSVRGLMGPGVDPHSYRQTRTDIVAMTRADLVLANGLYLEAQMEEFLHTLTSRVPVVEVATAVPQDQLRAHPSYPDRVDPHVWMAPTLWSHATDRIGGALIAAVPGAAAVIEEQLHMALMDCTELDSYAREVLASVPEPARVLVTAHDAFGYFGREYGFEVLGIQGISTESEAGLNRIAEVVDLLVTRKIGAVFVESSVSDRNVRALIEGAAARGHAVQIGGELYSDAMGPDGSYEGSYFGMIDHNVTTIARALGGSAPERGVSGKLKGES